METPKSSNRASDFEGAPAPVSEEYAKSSPPPSPEGEKSYDPRAIRADRYRLLATARGLLYGEGVRRQLQFPNKIHATTKCRYVTHGDVRVMQSLEHASAFYAGLVTCGSVWSCPVCSALIQERRRVELEKAINWAYENDLQPVMVTLTFPHTSWQTIKELLDGQADALTRLRRGSPWDRFKERIGYEGLIRGLETKYGNNGWHNHTHELFFVSKSAIADLSTDEARAFEAEKRGCAVEDLDGLADMKSVILARWERACRGAGLLDNSKIKAFRDHAVDVKGWCSASDYLAKQDDARNWGIDRELAKANSKTDKSGKKGIHPFGLLAMADEGDEKAGDLFVEYSIAIRGRAQLFWSRGLKAKVGIVDKTDEEIGAEEQDRAKCLGLLEQHDWEVIRAVPGAMSKVLDTAEKLGWRGVRDYLSELKRDRKTDGSAYAELRTKAKEREKMLPASHGLRLGRGRRTPAKIIDYESKPLDLGPGNLDLPF